MTQETSSGKKTFEDAINIVEEMCPTEWAIIGKELRDMSVPHSGPDYSELAFCYVQKSTIVDIIKKLGFKI